MSEEIDEDEFYDLENKMLNTPTDNNVMVLNPTDHPVGTRFLTKIENVGFDELGMRYVKGNMYTEHTIRSWSPSGNFLQHSPYSSIHWDEPQIDNFVEFIYIPEKLGSHEPDNCCGCECECETPDATKVQ